MTQQANTWKSKFFAVLFTSIVIASLILSGPAQGFTLNLSLDKTDIEEGDTLTFTAEIDIPSGENLPIDYFILKLDGPTDKSCFFDVNGNFLTPCDGITITQDTTTGFGYGYGYGYFAANPNTFGYGYGYTSGKIRYIITLDTENFADGDYDTFIELVIGTQTFSQAGNMFTIDTPSNGNSNSGGSCLTVWSCSEWSACIDGVQTRTCDKEINYCYAGTVPATSRSCDSFETLSTDTTNTIDLTNQNNEPNTTINQTLEALNELGSTITGAVVGVTESEGNIIILLLVLSIITLAGIVVIVHRYYSAPAIQGKFYVYL